MQDRPARLTAGSDVSALMTIGQANFGKFRFILWDESGRNPVLVGPDQTNVDNIPDIVRLGPAADLNNRILTWEGLVTPYKNGPETLYSVIVDILQENHPVPDGVIPYSFDVGSVGTQAFFWGVRFIII